MSALPSVDDILADAVVVSLPMRVRFRGITTREAVLLRGPAGWGEFAPFVEYDDDEAAHWLQAGLEAAWLGPPAPVRTRVPVNATVPAVPAHDVAEVLSRFPGALAAKVKVAEPGRDPAENLARDLARVRAVRELVPHVRVDANGGWSVDEAVHALTALTADGPLEYAEQPCARVEELVEVRRRLPGVRIAADESIRKVSDPLRVVRAGAADVAVVKVPPLGGMRNVVALAEQLSGYGVPVVVSSALDTAVGMSAGLAAAAALPELPYACGLATGRLFHHDVAPGEGVRDGSTSTGTVVPDSARLRELAASEERARWWLDRVRRCREVLAGREAGLFV
ncbi:o-succinylbenzoate synthase [Rhodococcus triatomae]|uniref:o-succinylbenzoate synthase n=1 Tax=Rhodococcus triatomae TaxID=300028 RepID=A0A1G8JB57_9NOCA|nr:o-succinylbenzoate synthase [Rhodococcus triatomae]QNG19765.1 o-succinylbenzoate synthase [Rhodococcus triatomae]QNG24319.1 o-succinylbenzoate synthase [Rhodococcus triatomae]SDI28217.1 O-succinylbenzoate synthase [Rhodococcus triatomae]